MPPLCNWDTVPLVVDKATTARILNISVTSINRALKAGTMLPAPMPRITGNRWCWSREVLRKYVEGGYQSFRVAGRRSA